MIDKEALTCFLDQPVRIVKDDGFVISGRIQTVFPNCFEFFTDGKILLISFERVKEIVSLRRRNVR